MNLTGVLLSLAAGTLGSFAPWAYCRAGQGTCEQLGLQFWANAFLAAGCLVLIPVTGQPVGGTAFLLISAGAGVLFTLNNYSYFGIAAHRGPLSISWSVIWTAAAIIAVLSWIFLREPVRALQPFGLTAFLGCLALMGLASYRTARKRGQTRPVRKGYWPWLLIALTAGALANFAMKFKNGFDPVGGALAFIFMRCAISALVLGGACAARHHAPSRRGRILPLALLVAAINGVSWSLILVALDTCDAAGVFPVTAGSSIICGALLAVFSGERPSRWAYAGTALAIVSIVLISLGGEPLLATAE